MEMNVMDKENEEEQSQIYSSAQNERQHIIGAVEKKVNLKSR